MSLGRSLRVGCVLLLAAVTTGAQETPRPTDDAVKSLAPAAPEATGGLRYRQIYVPQDRIGELARGYLPLHRDKFQGLVDSLRGGGADATPGPRIVSAEYRAKLERPALLRGDAELDVRHAGGGIGAIAFDGCGLALSKPIWRDASAGPATIASLPDGNAILLVDRTAKLACDWTLRGTESTQGEVLFDISLPACPSSSVLIELPRDLAPLTDKGIVTRLADSAADDGFLRWRVELGGHSRVLLRVLPEAIANQPATVLSHHDVTCDFSLSSARISAEVHLDVIRGSFRQLHVSVDTDAQLLSAFIGDTRLPIVEESTEGNTGGRFSLRLPGAIRGVGHIVRLSLHSPLVLGQPWKIPTIRADATTWQTGKATLRIPDSLSLADLTTADCRVSKIGALAPKNNGELVQLQFFSESGAAAVTFQRQPAKVAQRVGTTVQFKSAEVSAETVSIFTSKGGSSFSLLADLPMAWTVDSVIGATTAADGQADVIEHWDVKDGGPLGKTLHIQLSQPITQQQNVRLTIAARRWLPVGDEPLGMDQLRVVRFRDVEVARRLVDVQTEPSTRVVAVGDAELTLLSDRQLDPADAELVSPAAQSLLFEDDRGARELSLKLIRERPGYTADILVRATVKGRLLDEEYRIQCVPEGGLISEVLVVLSQSREQPPQWSLDGESDRSIQAEKLPTDSLTSAGFRQTGEVWRIVLRRPRAVQFTLVADRSSALENETSVATAWLPRADSQNGELLVCATNGSPIDIDDSGLEALPVSSPPRREYSDVRARFRYEPAQQPQIPLAGIAPTEDSQFLAVAWLCHVVSRYGQGQTLHEVTYRMENSGQPFVNCQRPHGVRLRQVFVNGEEAAITSLADDASTFLIPLPERFRYPVVRLILTTDQQAPLVMGEVEAPNLEIDVPVMHRRWTALLPSGYAPLDPSAAREDRLSLAKRLLGPLSRGSSPPLRLFRGDDWRKLVQSIGSRQQAREDVAACLQSLGRLAIEIARRDGESAVTWGALLTAYSDLVNRQDEPTLLPLKIDRFALYQLNVDSTTPVLVAGDSADFRLLEGTGLLVAIEGSSAVLTSRLAMSFSPDATQLLDSNGAVVETAAALTGPENAAAADVDRYVDVEQWIADPRLPRDPWPPAGDAGMLSNVGSGWIAMEMDSPASGVLRARVFRPATFRSIGWGILFIVAAGGWWVAAKRPLRLIWLFGLTGFAAIVAPAHYTIFTSSGFLGALVAACLTFCWHRTTKSLAIPADDTSATQVAALSDPAGAVVLFFAVVVAAATTGADDEAATATPQAVHRVLIPIDAQQQPAGDYVYLDRPFYDEIQRRAALLNSAPKDWFIASADYECNLRWESVGRTLQVDDLIARFELDVLSDGARVILPIHNDRLMLMPERALLGGQRVDINWTPDGRGISIDVKEAKRQTLEIALRPAKRTFGATSGFDVVVPGHPQSTLKINVPEGVAAIEVPSARGATVFSPEARVLRAELGSVNRLAVRWPASPDSEQDALAVEELYWLKAAPGSMIIEAQFRFVPPREKPLGELRIAMDPRLKMRLAPDQPVVVTGAQAARDKDLQVVTLKPTEEVDGELTFVASFSPNAGLRRLDAGVGDFEVPVVRTQQATAVRRWFAVSASPALILNVARADARDLLPGASFTDRWIAPIPEGVAPEFVYRQAAGDPRWSIHTRPTTPRLTVDQTVDISLGRNEAEFDVACQLTIDAGSLYRLKLRAPRNFRIDEVSLRENNIQRVTRWSRGSKSIVDVFLNAPISGKQELRLRGSFALRLERPATLSIPALMDAESRISRLDIYRQADVTATMDSRPGLRDIDDAPVGQYRPGLGRLLVSLQQDNPEKKAGGCRVQVTPRANDAFAVLDAAGAPPSCNLITYLYRESDTWYAVVEGQLRDARGVVDALRLDAAPAWRDVASLDADNIVEPIAALGQNDRGWIVRPLTPAEGEMQFRLRGKLAAGAVHVPRIALVDVDESHIQRFFVLPNKRDGQPIQWDTRDLSSATLPEENRGHSGEASGVNVYRAIGPNFHATIANARLTRGVPQIWLADIHASWDARGDVRGLATLDLDPAGQAEYTLELPDAYELIQVSVSGVPAILRSDNGQLRLKLGFADLPQTVRILFSGHAEKSAAGGLSLAAPRLTGVPIERTLWTIHSPPDSRWRRSPNGGSELSALRQQLLRYRSAALIVDFAPAEADSPDDVERWYSQWARRLASAHVAMANLVALDHEGAEIDASEVELLGREQAAAAARLDMTRVRNQSLEEAQDVSHNMAFWGGAGFSQRRPLRLVYRGAADHVTFHRVSDDAHDSILRMAGGAAVLTLTVLVVLVLRRGWLADWFAQWPHACGVALGLAWWLWLTPSVVGWLIVLVSLFGAAGRHGIAAPKIKLR